MACTFEVDLSAYVEGDLPPAKTRLAATHLEGCAECRTLESLIRRTLKPGESPEVSGSEQAREAVWRSMEEQTSLLFQLSQFFRRKDGKDGKK